MIMRKLLFAVLAATLFSCTDSLKKPYVQYYDYIAHAGGAIGEHIYTNSRESLDSALAKGYRFIELDFQFTSDSVLVAAHSWEEFNLWTGFAACGNKAPTCGEFTERRIHGRYTPLTAKDVHAFFMQHEDLYLVTDKISNPELLAKYFPGLKERMVVEAFSYEHYRRLRQEGYFRVLYSCMARDLESALVKNMLLDWMFPGERIEWVALHTSGFESGFFKFLYSVCDFRIALFTVDDICEIDEEYADRVWMIYTNRLLPDK